MKATYEKPIVTIDVVALTLVDDELSVLLVKRDKGPFEGSLSLPGGFIHVDEDASLESAAERILREKAGAENFHIEQLQTFSGSERDPRGYSVSISYLALVPLKAMPENAVLAPVKSVAGLAFDHDKILEVAVDRLRKKAVYSTAPAALLGDTFTLNDLISAYETIFDAKIDQSSFRRKMTEMDLLTDVGTTAGTGLKRGRASRIYSLKDGEVKTFDRTIGLPNSEIRQEEELDTPQI